jgi:basic membrane protein A
MKTNSFKFILTGLVCATGLTLVISGCAKKAAPAARTAAAPAAKAGLKIVEATTSTSIDDGSFNQNCWEGIQAFIKANPGATATPVNTPDMSQSIPEVQQVVGDYDVIVLPGFQYAPIGEIAQANPTKKFILVDSYPTMQSDSSGKPVELPNVYAMTFKEEESGFYAGIAAALASKTGKVAVINGIAYPSNVNYEYGFYSGVNYADKHYGAKAQKVEIDSYKDKKYGGNYIGSFDNEATGKQVGQALINAGCDVLFIAAGGAGNGAINAAKEATSAGKKVWVVGVDVDQWKLGANGSSNVILTSGLKIMDKNVTAQLQAIKDGTFKGQNVLLGATSSIPSTGYVSAAGHQQLTDQMKQDLADAQKRLEAGQIVPAGMGGDPNNFPGL